MVLKCGKIWRKKKIRPKLWLEYVVDGKRAYMLRACYTLSKEVKRMFCECLYDIKLPTAYFSNMNLFISIVDTKLIGMKSHDCHVMMQVFLPIAL